MNEVELIPYGFARERFSHACRELAKTERPVKDRLLDTVVALAPLRPEDLPRACQVLHEKMQRIIGVRLWDKNTGVDGLLEAIRSLSLERAEAAARCVAMANATLDRYCGVEACAVTISGRYLADPLEGLVPI